MNAELSKKDIVVVIPIYKATPSIHEQICITQTLKVLSDYSICFVAPENIDNHAYTTDSVSFKYFEKKYFEGLAGYNKLMLSDEFYSAFSSYAYILICQPDVFVFADTLLQWAQKGFDYIGAPWIKKPFRNVVFYVFVKEGIAKTIELVLRNKVHHAVGNGGLSLRKTATFLNFIKKYPQKVNAWKSNEDFFWSFFTWKEKFNKPDFKEAVSFCIETESEYCLDVIQNKLPFGIHGWPKVNGYFWSSYIKERGYEF
jgi:hypothetical protein